jgi:hypothetical protein
MERKGVAAFGCCNGDREVGYLEHDCIGCKYLVPRNLRGEEK